MYLTTGPLDINSVSSKNASLTNQATLKSAKIDRKFQEAVTLELSV